VACELYLAEGQGHGFVNMAPWNVVSSKCAADFFMRTGLLDKTALPETPVGELKKYNGEPVETILIKTNRNPTRAALEGRGGKRRREVPATTKKEGL
jgi:hypothetical protein